MPQPPPPTPPTPLTSNLLTNPDSPVAEEALELASSLPSPAPHPLSYLADIFCVFSSALISLWICVQHLSISLLKHLMFLFVYWDRVWLCSPSWHWTLFLKKSYYSSFSFEIKRTEKHFMCWLNYIILDHTMWAVPILSYATCHILNFSVPCSPHKHNGGITN